MEKEFLIAQAFCFHSSDGDKSWTANKHFTGMCLCNFSAACQRCERRLRQSFVLESHCVTHKMFTLEVACESWKFPKQWLSKKKLSHTRKVQAHFQENANAQMGNDFHEFSPPNRTKANTAQCDWKIYWAENVKVRCWAQAKRLSKRE